MLSLETIQAIKQIFLSDRISVRGQELPMISNLLMQLTNEENLLMANSFRERTRPMEAGKVVPLTPAPAAPVDQQKAPDTPAA